LVANAKQVMIENNNTKKQKKTEPRGCTYRLAVRLRPRAAVVLRMTNARQREPAARGYSSARPEQERGRARAQEDLVTAVVTLKTTAAAAVMSFHCSSDSSSTSSS
jgi:hypothetical protein